MKLKIILSFLFILYSLIILAQGGKAVFEKTEHNYGRIQEENGNVPFDFKFTNNGNAPLIITDVEATCGCTIPDWPKKPILVGNTGLIKVIYGAKGRPGHFNKSIVVKTNGTPARILLRVKGEVLPEAKQNKDNYRVEIGNLRLKTSYISFGTVYHKETKSKSVTIYNQGNRNISFKLSESEIPEYYSVSLNKYILKPKDSTKLNILFNASLKNDWGHFYESFELITDDPLEPNKEIHLSALIKEKFSNKASNPKIVLDKTLHDFGEIKQGTSVSSTFKITNRGNASLIIRKIIASCRCTSSLLGKEKLSPDESAEIKITYSSSVKNKAQDKDIIIISNDPINPRLTIKIKAFVKDEIEN